MGEGDVVAGANLLAAMACTLANIHRPGSGLKTAEGATLAVGTSMLISGSHSCSLVSERILRGLGQRQANILSHIRSHDRQTLENTQKKGFGPASVAPTLPGHSPTSMMEDLYRNMSGQDASGHWGNLAHQPAHSRFADLSDHPLVFITGDKPADLKVQLERCHLGSPFIHVGVESVGGFARFEHQCPAIMEGRATAGPTSTIIRGTVVVTDSLGVLEEAVRTGAPSAKWLSKTIWLVDGRAGPEPDNSPIAKPPVALDFLEQRFEAAITRAWGRRIDTRKTEPVTIEFDFTTIQARWVGFLKKMEPEYPGIVGSARNLLATLIFGFHQLHGEDDLPDGFKLFTNHSEALAKFLVHRMVNARAVMVRSAESDWKRRTEITILSKLREGPLSVRQLVRKSHRLASNQCWELLLDLEACGRVVRSGDEWLLPEPAVLSAPVSEHHLTLDV